MATLTVRYLNEQGNTVSPEVSNVAPQDPNHHENAQPLLPMAADPHRYWGFSNWTITNQPGVTGVLWTTENPVTFRVGSGDVLATAWYTEVSPGPPPPHTPTTVEAKTFFSSTAINDYGDEVPIESVVPPEAWDGTATVETAVADVDILAKQVVRNYTFDVWRVLSGSAQVAGNRVTVQQGVSAKVVATYLQPKAPDMSWVRAFLDNVRIVIDSRSQVNFPIGPDPSPEELLASISKRQLVSLQGRLSNVKKYIANCENKLKAELRRRASK